MIDIRNNIENESYRFLRFGVITLGSRFIQVTVVDRNEHEEHNLRLNVRNLDYLPNHGNRKETNQFFLFIVYFALIRNLNNYSIEQWQ